MRILKFNESFDNNDILENFQNISDILGDPEFKKIDFNNSHKYVLTWKFDFDLTNKSKAIEIIPNLKSIVDELDDVLSAVDRLPDFEILISFRKELIIELLPKKNESGNYSFIKDFLYGRVLIINREEIERYAINNNAIVTKYDTTYSMSEITETNELLITFNIPGDYISNLHELISSEIIEKSGEDFENFNGRSYEVGLNSKSISIYPLEEKSYVK